MKRRTAISAAVVSLGLHCVFFETALAAPPTLESVFPPGGKRGGAVEVTLNGKFDPWPCSFWFSGKGLAFEPDPEKAGTGKITIAADAPLGPVLLRAHNAEGATAPLLFIVGEQNEIKEAEKGDSTVAGASAVDKGSFPLVVNGTLSAGGELDSYRIALEKGETLHAKIEAYGLRSLVDPALHLHDLAGNRLELVHDSPANLDPLLSFTAPEKGDYVLSVAGFSHPPAASVAYTGSKNAHYRLYLALKRQQLPARLLPVDPGPDSKETAIAVGKAHVGTLPEDGSPARLSLAAKKGEKILLKVEGRALGYPIDPVLRLLKPDGAEIRREDDSNKMADPEYLWTVAADGDYAIEVTDRFKRGGEGMRYRLLAAPPTPDFTLVADKSLYALERGKAVEIKLVLTRLHGHVDDLAFTLAGLPDDIVLTAPEKAPEKNGDVVLKLEAKPDAKPLDAPVRILAKEKRDDGSGKEKTVVFSFKDDNYRGPYALDETPDLWLTLPPPKEETKVEEKEKTEAEKQ